MRSILSERNIVVVLFVMVLVIFSLAHEDTKKMEQVFQGTHSSTAVLANPKPDPALEKQEKEKPAILPASFKQ